jgi:hypothetical protein
LQEAIFLKSSDGAAHAPTPVVKQITEDSNKTAGWGVYSFLQQVPAGVCRDFPSSRGFFMAAKGVSEAAQQVSLST